MLSIFRLNSAEVCGDDACVKRELAAAMAKNETSEVDHAYEQICNALLQGKLRSGTQLRERQLAEVFGLTRGAVRKVLARLSAEGKVESVPNRGAFVPQPTSAQVRQLYSARKAVEAGLAGLLARQITPAQLRVLRSHTDKQRDPSNPRETTVRLSGDFHVKLSQLLGSPQLEEIISNLMSRTQVLVALFEPESHSGCAPDEHDKITDALQAGDAQQAFEVMLWHLCEVEKRILSHLEEREKTDLRDIFRGKIEKG